MIRPLVVAALMAAAMYPIASVRSETTKAGADATFAQQAMRDGQQEVSLGQLALQKSKNEDVKRFAQMMVTDHSAANDKLKSLVQDQRSESPRNAAPGAG